MTYKEQYYKIIQHRQANPLENGVYGERHHIYPRSLFPQFVKAKWNIVKLSPQEHYTCHYLLVKWFEESVEREAYNKMVFAWRRMAYKKNGLIVSPEQYAELKEKHSEVLRNSEKAKENRKKATEASRHSEKAKEAQRKNIKKAHEAARHSERQKAAARQNIKKAQEAAYKSEKFKETSKMNTKKAIEAADSLPRTENQINAVRKNAKKACDALRKPFTIDGVRFESQRDAAKHFGVCQRTVCTWLNGITKTSHICKYINKESDPAINTSYEV